MVRSEENIIRYSWDNKIVVKCYICTDDDPVVDDGGEFSTHVAAVHSSNALSIQPYCEICKMITEDGMNFSQHMKKHKKKANEEMKRIALKKGKISVCFSRTIKAENKAEGDIVHDLRRVIELEKIIVGYICTVCNESIVDDEDLRNHMANGHMKENIPVIFSCGKCEYTCSYKSNLKRHKKIMHESGNGKNFSCKKRKCVYSGKTEGHLKRHEQSVHENAEDLQCDNCEFKCKRRSDLNRHNRIKHNSVNVTEFKCRKCEYSCKLAYNLNRHEKNRHNSGNVTKFKCKKCAYLTKFEHNSKRHEKRKHDS